MITPPQRGWFPDPQRKNRRRFYDDQQWVGPSRLRPASVFRRVFAITAGSVVGLLALMIMIGLMMPGSTTAVTPHGATSTAQRSAADPRSSATTPASTATPPPSPTAEPQPSRTIKSSSTPITAAPGSALAVAASLMVKGRAPKTGYLRRQFGSAWPDSDGNGCRQREDVLNRDLSSKTFDGCKVLSGLLRDPYTGATISFRRGRTTSAEVQIDHVVALSDAWQKGAQQWTPSKRVRFANDTLNLQAVGRSVNASKGDGDTATWLPPNTSYRCAYVARQVSVKKDYGLWVTSAERDAMVRILSRCSTMKIVERTPIPSHPAPKRVPSPKTQPPGADSTSTGEPSSTGGAGSEACAPGYSPCVPPFPPDLDCSDVDGPIRVTGDDPHRLDGDGDGIACERS